VWTALLQRIRIFSPKGGRVALKATWTELSRETFVRAHIKAYARRRSVSEASLLLMRFRRDLFPGSEIFLRWIGEIRKNSLRLVRARLTEYRHPFCQCAPPQTYIGCVVLASFDEIEYQSPLIFICASDCRGRRRYGASPTAQMINLSTFSPSLDLLPIVGSSISIQCTFAKTGDSEISAVAPDGTHPHAIASRAYYMLSILNAKGVPSEGNLFICIKAAMRSEGQNGRSKPCDSLRVTAHDRRIEEF